MKVKSLFSLLLALVMVLSLTAISPAALAEGTVGDTDSQINLIFSKLNDLKQNDSQIKWYYSVTDMDHDGQLEFVAAAQHPADRSTNLRVWEVNTDGSTLTEFNLNKDPDESFPDILTDTADTYHDPENNTWYYMCYDNIIISPTDVYTLKCAVSLKDGTIGYNSFAVEHTEVMNGFRNVSHTDAAGMAISPEQYVAAGTNAFAGTERSSTNFDWFTADDATSLARLTDSYLVFNNQKAPTETFPVPKPEALQQPAATPVPVPSSTPVPAAKNTAPVYLTVTKNPTNENNRKVGGKATFVSCANAFESLSWTMVAPDGGEYSVPSFRAIFPYSNISGEYSTTLSIGNVDANMNGWGAYCTFYYKGQVASTSVAWIYVNGSGSSAPVVTPPQSGSFSAYVADYSYSTVTLYVYDGGGYTQDVGRDICHITGDIYIGAPCTAYYDGIGAHGAIFTYVAIQGSEPQPSVTYGSMSGIAYHDTAFTEYIVLSNGSSYHIDGNLCNIVYGTYTENGCSCTVYYTDYPSAETIYQVDIYGEDVVYEPDQSNIEEMGGWAGSNYYENEAQFGNVDLEEEYGGWAGSNYYENEAEFEDQGGWAGSNYYDYEDEYEDQGGWAGSNYYDYEDEYENG